MRQRLLSDEYPCPAADGSLDYSSDSSGVIAVMGGWPGRHSVRVPKEQEGLFRGH